MAKVFIPQREKLEERERLTDEQVKDLNWLAERSQMFLKNFGVDFPRSGDVAERDGAPRLFTLKDGKATPLAQSGVEVGSKQFWELAMMGQMFGYELGKKHPVQIQAWMGKAGPDLATSSPLDPEKQPTEPEPPKEPRKPVHPGERPQAPEGGLQHPVEPIEPKKPEAVPEPSGLTKFFAFFGGSKSKQQVQAYRQYEQDLEKYEQDMETYETKRLEYDEALIEYEEQNKTLLQYDKDLMAYETAIRSESMHETLYQKYKAEWDEQHRTFEADAQARQQCAQALQDTFGAQRTEKTLKAEQAEQQALGKVSGAEVKLNTVQGGIDGMVSMYGPKPQPKEQWMQPGNEFYEPQDFEHLPEIKIDAFSVGGQKLSDEEFGALAMFAGLTPQVAKNSARRALPPIRDMEGAAAAFAEQGYEQQVFDEAILNTYYGTISLDAMNDKTPREQMSAHIRESISPARLEAHNALVDYQRGNKQPLAEILSRAVDKADMDARLSAGSNTASQSLNQVAMEMVDMLERDPELMQLAKQSSDARENAICGKHPDFYNAGPFEKKIAGVKGRAAQRELQQESYAAEEKLARYQAAGQEMPQEQKKECARTILREKLISTVYKTATNKTAKELTGLADKLDAQTKDMTAKHDLDIDVRNTKMAFQIGMVAYRSKRPEVLDMIQKPKAMEALDQQLDKLIEKDGLLNLPTKELQEKLNRGYESEDLLNKVNDIVQQQKQPDQPQPKVEQKQQGGPTLAV